MRLAALRVELAKLYRQRSAYAGFAVMLALAALVTWGSHRQRHHLDVSEAVPSEFVVAGKTVTALFVAQAVMEPSLVVMVPVLIAVVAGALVAGERQTGTLRTLLTRPVRRWVVLTAKLLAGWSYAILITLFLGLCTLGLGQAVFGWGDLVVFRGGLTILDAHTGLIRLAEGYGLAAGAMCVVAALALMLSTIFDNAMVAAGLTVALLILSNTIGVMPYFEDVKPHLLTTHLRLYREVFAATVDTEALTISVHYLAAYLAAIVVVALAVFARRDVTC
ncbi:MAG: ABC transporter permease [Armatimonadota bacterium]